MARLAGKVAVITGGSSGIGLATPQRFVDEGASVFIVGRRQGELDKAKALIGLDCVYPTSLRYGTHPNKIAAITVAESPDKENLL